MWALGATVLTEVIKGVSSHIQNYAAPQQQPPPYYSEPTTFEKKQDHSTSQRTPNKVKHAHRRHNQTQASCSNCSSHSEKQRNKPPTKSQTGKPKKGSVYIINVPENGNFEVRIKKTQAEFAQMSMNDQSRPKTNKNTTKPQNGAKPAGIKKAPAQKTWMYLGRLKFGTSEYDLQNFLAVRFPKRQFVIVELPLYREGTLPCFKVLVDNAILDEFQDGNLWPAGVKITKYHNNFKN